MKTLLILSGRNGFSLTRLGSWGARLVELGCGGFVGTLWPVSEEAAFAFAQALDPAPDSPQRASVTSTNVASLRRLPLHKGLQDKKLHQIEADRRKYA